MKHSYYAQEIYYLKALIFFQKKVVGGQPPVNDRRVGGKHNTVKQADSGLGGWILRKFQGEPLKSDHALAFCQASFRMTLSWVGFFTLDPGRYTPRYIKIKMIKIKDEERILTVVAREKQLVVYKVTAISPSADFQQKLYKPEWSTTY